MEHCGRYYGAYRAVQPGVPSRIWLERLPHKLDSLWVPEYSLKSVPDCPSSERKTQLMLLVPEKQRLP